MSAISAEGLVKDYRPHRALHGLSLEVPRGSVFGFLGPNGSGKTTTIKILLGLLRADAGRATLLNRPAGMDLSLRLKRKLGYLPEEVNFPEALTGREVLRFVYRSAGLQASGEKKEIDRLLEYFQLLSAAGRRCAGYSRGMKQRLGLAATLLARPELLILDEPVSALDPAGRREILEMLVSLRGRATVFFSSHVLTDVERVCDQVAVLNRGRLVVQSSLGELLENNRKLFYHVETRRPPGEETIAKIRAAAWAREARAGESGVVVEAEPELSGRLEEELLPLLLAGRHVVTAFTRRQPTLEQVFLELLDKDNARLAEGSDTRAPAPA